MKTLYVSDLDGTLLNKQAVLSEFTVKTLNKLIDNGMNFTIATSRGDVAIEKMEKVNVSIPMIILNGALIYNKQKREYEKVEKIDLNTCRELFKIVENTKQESLILFSLYNNKLNEYFRKNDNKEIAIKRKKTHKNMIFVDSFNELLNQDIVYFNFKDKKEKIFLLLKEIQKFKDIDYIIHNDIYSDEYYFLECFHKNANKYNGIDYLNNKYKFDKIISFGDGSNDLPLAEKSDEFYAPENADENIKEMATSIIEKHSEDGVAKWLLSNFDGRKKI